MEPFGTEEYQIDVDSLLPVLIPSAMGQNRRLYEWALAKAFGQLPDAVVVVDRVVWDELEDPARVALVAHELRHLRQKHTPKGEPVFAKEDGRPVLVVEGQRLRRELVAAEEREETPMSELERLKVRIERLELWISGDCECPCCGERQECEQGCTFAEDCPNEYPRMESARAVLYGAGE